MSGVISTSSYTHREDRRGCFNCERIGHSQRLCPDACKHCGKRDHVVNACPSTKQIGGLGSGVCHKCQEFGHKKDACPNKYKGPIECVNCYKDDHLYHYCPSPCMNCGDPEHRINHCPAGQYLRRQATLFVKKMVESIKDDQVHGLGTRYGRVPQGHVNKCAEIRDANPFYMLGFNPG
eukprot:202440_1